MQQNFDNIRLAQSASVRDAMKIIDSGAMRIAVILGNDNKLVGILTDGDIRRGILNGLQLGDSIETIINHSPVTCDINADRDHLILLAKKYNLHQIPVLDNGRLVAVEDVNAVSKTFEYQNKAVLMAGGLGRRLMPLTKNVPKPMLHVGDKPILETIIDGFRKHGFKNIVLSVSYKSEIIKDYFGDGTDFGVSIEYVHENDRMGTAGALSLMRDKLCGDFFVMNADLLTRVNFQYLLHYHQSNDAAATMGVRKYALEVPYGVVKMDGGRMLKIEEKPKHEFFVNAGIYVLNSSVLSNIPDGQFYDMPTLFSELLEKKLRVSSFPIREYWTDIGRSDELDQAKKDYTQVFCDA